MASIIFLLNVGNKMSNLVAMNDKLYKRFVAAIDPTHLELRLFSTEKCNFRCVYCYEDFELGRMEQWVRNGIKNLIEQRCANGLKSLYISWFGGEPLLGLEVIEEIELFRNEMRAKYPDLMSDSSGITTNGYLLTTDILCKLVNLGVKSYQITLDGSPIHHNKTRLRADGEGTYEKILENLIAASKTALDFNIDIRMHLHSKNIDDVENLLTSELIRLFAHDKRFNLHPISIGDFGGAFGSNSIKTTTRKIADASRESILKRFATARSVVVGGSVADLSSAPLSVSEGANSVCYAAAANSFAIRADGNLVKCTTALDDPRNKIGNITESGELNIKPELVKLWMIGFISGDEGELACPLYKVSMLPLATGARIIPIVAEAVA